MTLSTTDPFAGHGGLLIPLDMFRVSVLAGVMGDLLVGKARNVLDARLVLTRHPQTQLVLGTIEGSVIGDDAATFWKENADLAMAASQAIPRQVFLYFAKPGPGADRVEGFIVAQRAQVLAAEEATADTIPAGAGEEVWPVSRLCEQLGLSMSDLAGGFSGGPRVEVSLVEPTIDDQKAIMILAGQVDPTEEENDADPRGASVSPVDDAARRAAMAAEEEAQAARRAAQVKADLPLERDELGVVVTPSASLEEASILAPFVVSRVEGDLPEGIPRDLTHELQGLRIDIAVRVEFLSEVFVENTPMSRPEFEKRATTTTVDGLEVRGCQVLAPRLGYGTLFARDRSYVFVSRNPDLPVPQALVKNLLESST